MYSGLLGDENLLSPEVSQRHLTPVLSVTKGQSLCLLRFCLTKPAAFHKLHPSRPGPHQNLCILLFDFFSYLSSFPATVFLFVGLFWLGFFQNQVFFCVFPPVLELAL